MCRTQMLGLMIVAAAVGCGAVKSESSGGDGQQGDPNSQDGSAGSNNVDGSVGTSDWVDGSAPSVDAGPPNAQCPAQYSVYGNQDASDSLGGVNPTLIASGTCTTANEQYGNDGGEGPSDFTMTFSQSTLRSGMFMATMHQTMPFPYDLTVCLEPDGPNTGSKPTTPGGTDGTMILTNVPEDAIPYNQYPKVVFDTNFQSNRQYGDFMQITTDAMQSFSLGSVKCTFVSN